jgi:hypothetical protein
MTFSMAGHSNVMGLCNTIEVVDFLKEIFVK